MLNYIESSYEMCCVHVHLGILYVFIILEICCLVCCKGLAVRGAGRDSSQPTFLERFSCCKLLASRGAGAQAVAAHRIFSSSEGHILTMF